MKQNKVRAIAIGTTELRTKELAGSGKSEEELKEIAAKSVGADPKDVEKVADNGMMKVYIYHTVMKSFVFFKKKVDMLRLVDKDGVIRLQRKNAAVLECQAGEWKAKIKYLLNEHTIHADGGAEIPNIYIILGRRIIDFAGMQSNEQILSLCEVELAHVLADEKPIMICTRKTENARG